VERCLGLTTTMVSLVGPTVGQKNSKFTQVIDVLDHGKGVCADPRRGDAIFGVGGPGPPKGMMSIS
jgi:hypothetical protein